MYALDKDEEGAESYRDGLLEEWLRSPVAAAAAPGCRPETVPEMGVPALIILPPAPGKGSELAGPKPWSSCPAVRSMRGRSTHFCRATRIDRIFVAVPPGQAGQFEEPGIITVEGRDPFPLGCQRSGGDHRGR